MYFDSPHENDFFASYGFLPETYNMDTYILRGTTYYNDKPLQGLPSDVFGDQGRSVTILASTDTGSYGLKKLRTKKIYCFPLIHTSAVYRIVYTRT